MSGNSTSVKFTGERVIEGTTPERIWLDHICRYEFASGFISGKDVLDIACGTGYGSKLLKDASALKVTGIDISQDSVDYAVNRYSAEGLDYFTGDATDISFSDSAFDAVVSFETIEHVKDYRLALKEIKRVLKQKGELIISSPNRILTSPGKSIEQKPDNEYHYVEFTNSEFAELLSEYFTIKGLYGQRPVNRILLNRYFKKIIRKLFPEIYSPEKRSPEVKKQSFFQEYRYLVIVCSNA